MKIFITFLFFLSVFTVSAQTTNTTAKKADSTQAKDLKGVTVTAIKPLIEQRIDRMIVNVDASPTNAGATALEVLEKSPGVTVDNDGNISLKGKAGVIVMMDGKPTYLSAADLANVLRNLPAASLDRIEIMTNPSSKYDAAGNSGIIDIRTKKSKNAGSNGSIAVGNTFSLFENRGNTEVLYKPNIALNYNYRKNKINFFGNAVYNYREGRGSFDIVSRYYREGKQIDSINNVQTFFKFRNNNYTLKTGLDFSPNKRTSYGVVLNGFIFEGRPRPETSTFFTDLDGNVFSRFKSVTFNEAKFRNIGGNFNYRHGFDSIGTEITADVDYMRYKNISSQTLTTNFFDGAGIQTAPALILQGYLPSFINIFSVKSDFVKPYKSKLKIEAGMKSSFVQSDNLVTYLRSSPNGFVPDARNNHFVYDENVNALYTNASKQFGKWQFQGGLRLEHTHTKGVQESNNSVVSRNYVSLFPSAFASYPLDKRNTITASVSRRLQRPNYQDLNPFTFFLDSLSYRQGNPYLTPQFTWNYELSHNMGGKLITTLNHTRTSDVISQIINRQRGSNDEIIGFLTSDNIAQLTNTGLAITAPVKFKKWWSANFYTNVYRNHYKGTYISNETHVPEVVKLDLAFTSFTFNISNTFNIAKGLTGEVSGFYRYKTIDQLNLAYPMGQISFGLAKNDLLNGRGTLRINARDPFNWQYYRGLTKYGTVDFNLTSRWDNRQYGINFTYRFGKQQQQQKQRARTSASEDEQRRAGSGGN